MKPKKKKNKTRKTENGFSKNLNLLKGRLPHVWEQVRAAKNSNRSPQQTQYFSSKNEPIADHIQKTNLLFYGDENPIVAVSKIIDEWKFEPYDVLFVIGLGLGYLPIEMLIGDIGHPRMVIIEPSLQFFEHTLHMIDLQPLLTNERVDLYVGEDIDIEQIVERYQERIPIGRNQVVVHPNYEKILGESIVAIKQALTERIRTCRDIWFTTKKNGQQMITNTIANLPSLFAGTPMKNLRGKFKGIPAVCVAAGPSLDHAIADLKRIQTNTLLIACDSAVNALLKAEIRPHIVVTTDIFETNIDKLKPHFEALRETVFIFSIESNPENVRLYLGQKRVAVSAYSKLLLDWLDPGLNLQSKFPAMTSVSHMAIFSALAMGADPIIMVGMDLAYSMGKSHSFDCAFFHSLDHNKLVSTHGNNGWLIPSSPQFVADKLLIEKIVGQSSVRFINTSINGANIAGTAVKRLSEVGEIECTSQLDADATIKAIDWQPVADETTAAKMIGDLIKQFVTFRELCSSKKKALVDEIDKIENHWQAQIDSKMIVEFENVFAEFQETNQVYDHMIKEIMLADLQEIYKKKEILSVDTEKDKKGLILENLNLLATQYEVYEKGMAFLINQLKTFNGDMAKVVELRWTNSEKNEVNFIELARYYANAGELWQAKWAYDNLMNVQPENITPYVELAQAYMKVNLWKPAHELIQQGRSVFKEAPEIDRLETEIECGIDGIMDEIKKEWMQGNMHTTRKLLNQYLILRPHDPQANELKKVIRALDEEFSGDWADEKKKGSTRPDSQVRLKQVVQLIKNRQFEKGIGILEGMIHNYPENGATIREQIGDIRAMQKDYQSAMWNYRQAMEIDPLKIEINKKVNKIKSLHN